MQASLGRSALSQSLGVLGVVLAGVLVAEVAVLSFGDRSGYRLLLAVLIGGGLLLLAWRSPRAAVSATLAFLLVMALVRRLLIPLGGWDSWDPLLLVGPAVAGFVAFRVVFVTGMRALGQDLFSALVLALVLLSGLEAFNPANGGLLAGLTGLLFGAVPLLWYFVGRNFGDRSLAAPLVAGVIVAGAAEALYGLWQTHVGLPPWDAAWLMLNGYDALHVGEEALRPFASLASSAEYAAILGLAATAAAAYLLHGRLGTVFLLPLLLWALVEASIRGALAFSVIAVIVMAALRPRRPSMTVAVLIGAVAVIGSVLLVLASPLEQLAVATGDPLVIHTVSGLVHPYDPSSSTLLEHQDLVVGGIVQSLQHPLGYGSAYLAGDKFSGPAVQTEVDISNAFVTLGPLGGLLYLGIVAAAVIQAIRLYRRRREPLLLAAAGLLVADLGQWLNGGFYAVAALVWLLVGCLTRETARSSEAAAADREGGRAEPALPEWEPA